jgi:uncharacterized protein (TIGR00266 family)
MTTADASPNQYSDGLQVAIRHAPSFAAVRLTIAAGQRIRTASGALYMRDAGLTLEAKMEGGLKGAFKRAVSGQSFFTSTYIGDPQRSTWLDLSQVLPGDIQVLQLDGNTGYVLTQGNWLASTAEVELDTKWGGFKSMLGGDRLIAVHLTGRGEALISSYGALDTFDLPAGQEVMVDLGHLVAYDDTMTVGVQTQGGGLMNSLKSGELLVVKLTGPGRVWTQSRSERELSDWVKRQVPSNTNTNNNN